MNIRIILPVLLAFVWVSCVETSDKGHSQKDEHLELLRPVFHFTPDSAWMNDPNGLVYHNGDYHMFYQYYPDSTVWGPMHWGHATSTDLVRWQHQPVALFPDKHGYIFSGSAVVDHSNTTGFGTTDNPPLVAIFTYHDPVKAETDPAMCQSQGLAYSIDNGKTWEKYENNPVLLSPGINDFRDPKVRWHPETSRWIMALAVKDHIRFYSSKDLKNWTLESEFGKEIGAHGGVWECPDLFPLTTSNNDEYWILIVSLNPGGPNGGSATQYFIGSFNGSVFTPIDTEIRWLDYGPDNYAGVTWSNTGERTIFIGWMSNWDYAQVVPASNWRSAMTIPRELHLLEQDGRLTVGGLPVDEMSIIVASHYEIPDLNVDGFFNLSEKANFKSPTFALKMFVHASNNFQISLSNYSGNYLELGYKKVSNSFYIDRSKSGLIDFHPDFVNIIEAPRFSSSDQMKLLLVADVTSLELFADDGTTMMTSIYFPEKALDQIRVASSGPVVFSEINFGEVNLNSMYK